MMEERYVDRDLVAVCEFEIALRNALAWQAPMREIVARYSDYGRPIDSPLLETTFSDVGRLIGAVATLRDQLGVQSDAPHAN